MYESKYIKNIPVFDLKLVLINSGFTTMTGTLDKDPFRLTVNGICPCGGKLVTSEWSAKSHRKGRTTCSACGRTELKQEKKDE
jgi:hypothetical protein